MPRRAAIDPEPIRTAWRALTAPPAEPEIVDLVAARIWPVAGGDGTETPTADPPASGAQPGSLEQLAGGESAAAPATPVLPNPDDEGGGEQDAGGGGEDDPIAMLRTALEEKGLKPSDVAAALLELVPEEERGEIPALRQEQERGANRERTERGDAEKAVREREEAFVMIESVGRQSAAELSQALGKHGALLRRADELEVDDPDQAVRLREQAARQVKPRDFEEHVLNIRQAAIAQVARAQSHALAGLRDKHKDVLGQLNDDEEATLRDARKRAARTGGTEEFEALLQIAVDRATAKGEQSGERKGERKASANGNAAELVLKIAEALGAAPPKVNGARPASAAGERARIQAEIDAIDPYTDPKAEEKLESLQRQLKALSA